MYWEVGERERNGHSLVPLACVTTSEHALTVYKTCWLSYSSIIDRIVSEKINTSNSDDDDGDDCGPETDVGR